MKLTLPSNQPLPARAPGQFAACARCAHSIDRMTPQGPVLMCRAIAPKGTFYSPDIITVGRARATGMPCGPSARLATGIPTALELERVESEVATGERVDIARKFGATSRDPFTTHDVWGGIPS